MDPSLRIACAIVAAYVLDRVFTGMARRGWIYWRGQPALAGPPAALACPSCGRVLRPSWLVVGGVVVACLAAFLARIIERP